MKNGNILKEIWLIKENVNNVYSEADRMDIKKINATLKELLEVNKFRQSWLENYRKDMLHYLETKHKPNSLFTPQLANDLLKVLNIIDNGQENLKRVLSIKCFGDSKYFEKNIEHILVRIIKKYLIDSDNHEEYSIDDILLRVRNFKISRNSGVLWRF